MILADSGYFIALARPRDRLHGVATGWARIVREPAVVTHYVLIEILNHLSTPPDRARGHALIQGILQNPAFVVIPASDELFSRGITLHQARADKSWSITDYISFVVMADKGIQRALAYDHQFIQAGFDALLRRLPS